MSSNFLYHENDTRFYINDSKMKNAGKGLFAKEKVFKGDKLMISGALVEKKSSSDICTTYANCYKFAASISNLRDGKIDCGQFFIIPLGYAALVNHSEENYNNVEIIYLANNEAAYVFLKDVEKDEEILGNYGETWNAMIEWSNDQLKSEKVKKLIWERFLDLNLYELGELR